MSENSLYLSGSGNSPKVIYNLPSNQVYSGVYNDVSAHVAPCGSADSHVIMFSNYNGARPQLQSSVSSSLQSGSINNVQFARRTSEKDCAEVNSSRNMHGDLTSFQLQPVQNKPAILPGSFHSMQQKDLKSCVNAPEGEKALEHKCEACHKALCSLRSLKRHRNTCRSMPQNIDRPIHSTAKPSAEIRQNSQNAIPFQPAQKAVISLHSTTQVHAPSDRVPISSAMPSTSFSAGNAQFMPPHHLTAQPPPYNEPHFQAVHASSSFDRGHPTSEIYSPPGYIHSHHPAYYQHYQQQFGQNPPLSHMQHRQQSGPPSNQFQQPPIGPPHHYHVQVPQFQQFSANQATLPLINKNTPQPPISQSNGGLYRQPSFQNVLTSNINLKSEDHIQPSILSGDKKQLVKRKKSPSVEKRLDTKPTTPLTAPIQKTIKFFGSPESKFTEMDPMPIKKESGSKKSEQKNSKPGRTPTKPLDPNKPVFSYLCPQCEKAYSCRKNVKKHLQKVHEISPDEGYNELIERVIKVDDNSALKNEKHIDIEKTTDSTKSNSKFSVEVSGKTGNISLKKRKSEPQISSELGKKQLLSPSVHSVQRPLHQASVNASNINKPSFGYTNSTGVPPLSAPPILNYHQQKPSINFSGQTEGGGSSGMIVTDVQHSREGQSYPLSAPFHVPQYQQNFQNVGSSQQPPLMHFSERSMSFDHSHFYHQRQVVRHPTVTNETTPNSAPVSGPIQHIPCSNNIYFPPQFECRPAEQYYQGSEAGKDLVSQNIFQNDPGPYQKTLANPVTTSYMSDLDYWTDFEQIKSDMDRPFVNRSKDDDLEMAKIAADLKRSAERPEPVFHNLPSGSYQDLGGSVPPVRQYFTNDTLGDSRFEQVRKPVERAEADTTFWEEDGTPTARSSSDSSQGHEKNISQGNPVPILVQTLNPADPATFVQHNGAVQVVHDQALGNSICPTHQTVIEGQQQGIHRIYSYQVVQVSNDGSSMTGGDMSQRLDEDSKKGRIPIGGSYQCEKCDRNLSTEYSLKRHHKVCDLILEKRNSTGRKPNTKRSSPTSKEQSTDPDSTTLYQVKEEPLIRGPINVEGCKTLDGELPRDKH